MSVDINKTTQVINDDTIFKPGECVKHKTTNNLYLIFIVSADYLLLLNTHDGSQEQVLHQEIVDNYVKININPIIQNIFSLQISFFDFLSRKYSSVLDYIVYDYALQICVNVVDKKGCAIKVQGDYPAIVVAVNERHTNKVVVDHEDDWEKTYWSQKYVDFVNKKGLIIGNKVNKFNIGNCAEQHAANDLATLYPDTNINNLTFSKAIRPRTGEIRLYCDNCCMLFGLNN